MRTHPFPRGYAIRWTLALLLPGLAAPVGAVRTAANLCGTTIVEDLELDEDLTCSGSGLIVGADGLKIDLDGHAINGSGVGIGIDVSGRTDVRISDGTIGNFLAAVRVLNSADVTIREVTFLGNSDGVDLQSGSVGVTIRENAFRDSLVRGVMMRSNTRDNVVKENTFTGNRVGILVNGPLDSSIKDNVISASGLAGIRVGPAATGNVIKENRIAANPAGIEFLTVPGGVAATGNTFVKNTIVMNTCGLQGPAAGNTFKLNVFRGNDADSCG
jgi:nitrous oxidase accessory protein NosD